jgi:hypothetical protein
MPNYDVAPSLFNVILNLLKLFKNLVMQIIGWHQNTYLGLFLKYFLTDYFCKSIAGQKSGLGSFLSWQPYHMQKLFGLLNSFNYNIGGGGMLILG